MIFFLKCLICILFLLYLIFFFGMSIAILFIDDFNTKNFLETDSNNK